MFSPEMGTNSGLTGVYREIHGNRGEKYKISDIQTALTTICQDNSLQARDAFEKMVDLRLRPQFRIDKKIFELINSFYQIEINPNSEEKILDTFKYLFEIPVYRFKTSIGGDFFTKQAILARDMELELWQARLLVTGTCRVISQLSPKLANIISQHTSSDQVQTDMQKMRNQNIPENPIKIPYGKTTLIAIPREFGVQVIDGLWPDGFSSYGEQVWIGEKGDQLTLTEVPDIIHEYKPGQWLVHNPSSLRIGYLTETFLNPYSDASFRDDYFDWA